MEDGIAFIAGDTLPGMTPEPTAGPLTDWLARAGNWNGVNRLWLGGPADASPSTLTVSAVIGGQFVRIDQRWSYQGRPQEGSLLVGHQLKPATVSAHWADTFHTARGVMAFTGTAAGDGAIEVRGTYSAGSGLDWGWRIRLHGTGPDQLRVTMHNIHPDGEEDLAVDAEYARDR